MCARRLRAARKSSRLVGRLRGHLRHHLAERRRHHARRRAGRRRRDGFRIRVVQRQRQRRAQRRVLLGVDVVFDAFVVRSVRSVRSRRRPRACFARRYGLRLRIRSSAVASSTSRSMSWLYERAPMASRAAACSGPATHAWHSVTSSRSNTASSAVNSKSRGWRKRTFTSSPVASAGNTATASFKFCSWFWRTISSSLADLSLTSSRRAARSDMSSAVLTRPVGRALQRDGVAEQQHVGDGKQGTRAVLVLTDYRYVFPPEKANALHLVEVLAVIAGRHRGRARAPAERARRRVYPEKLSARARVESRALHDEVTRFLPRGTLPKVALKNIGMYNDDTTSSSRHQPVESSASPLATRARHYARDVDRGGRSACGAARARLRSDAPRVQRARRSPPRQLQVDVAFRISSSRASARAKPDAPPRPTRRWRRTRRWSRGEARSGGGEDLGVSPLPPRRGGAQGGGHRVRRDRRVRRRRRGFATPQPPSPACARFPRCSSAARAWAVRTIRSPRSSPASSPGESSAPRPTRGTRRRRHSPKPPPPRRRRLAGDGAFDAAEGVATASGSRLRRGRGVRDSG